MTLRNYAKALVLLGVLGLPALLFAQDHAAHDHPGFFDNLFGEGDTEFVCFSRVHRNFYLAIFLCAAAVAVGFYSRYKLKKRTAEQLAKQKQVIEEQHRDITDSVRYARRLQEAVHPDHAQIRQLFSDSFIYSKPRDIVSGDFCWAAERKGKRFIAIADCTGHGIPGAFLSIIGHLALNKAVLEEGSEHPSDILDAMNNMVKKTLGQSKDMEQVADGMEVAICVWDPATNELAFAGAGRPLLLLQDGNLREIKGEKCSVGSHQPHVAGAPPTHAVRLKPGDSFYLCSDGITDQFGGPDGKKLGRKAFSELLLGSAAASMEEQAKKMEASIAQWQRQHAQTDDMMLIGVKV